MKRKEFLRKFGIGATFYSLSPYIRKFKIHNPSFGRSNFILQFNKGAICSLKRKGDLFDTNYILDNQRFGYVVIRYRFKGTQWYELSTFKKAEIGQIDIHNKLKDGSYIAYTSNDDITISLTYKYKENGIKWSIEVKNKKNRPIEIGDVAIPFPMNSSNWSWKKKVTYDKRVIRHSFISGHNSFLFWSRCNAVGPYLLITPINGTHLEYYDQSTSNKKDHSIYTAYIHSLAQKSVIKEKGSSWRQDHTSVKLQPKGLRGDRWKGEFLFQWADNYEKIRQLNYNNGLFNIHIEPGMTIPKNDNVRIFLNGKYSIRKMLAEFPEETYLKKGKRLKNGAYIYLVKFHRLGENKFTIYFGDDRYFILEFFITESIETLLQKRSKFITERLQIHNNNKWYNDVFSDWNMKDHYLLTPDNLHDIPKSRQYMVTCDDAGLGRPAFLSAKNVSYPVQEEVTALDNYIDNFVWGGLQIKDKNAYPYAIYGIPNWKVNRDSTYLGKKGQSHIWRIYDYPHVVLMYLSMCRIARFHKQISTAHPWKIYLNRAYQTAMAYYRYPLEVVNWSPYKTGNYNEIAILELINELDEQDYKLKAYRLRTLWEKKVKYFLSGKADLFASEYPYDTTDFESTQVFAKYALKYAEPRKGKDMPLKVTSRQARNFMDKQIKLNVGCRGWLEKAYYLYGSDYRAGGNDRYTLSYMSQMGGWAILDYVVNYAKDPYKYLHLAYASIWSSWALMNSGTRSSNYGYWFPGKINDGGAGGGFEPLAYGKTWLEQPHKRGPWYYSCEIDLGFCGFLRAASTILTKDPVFGLIVLGGIVKKKKNVLDIFTNDGLRRRFHFLSDNIRFHLELRYDRFRKNRPIKITNELDYIHFEIENIDANSHVTLLYLSGLLPGSYEVLIDKKLLRRVEGGTENKYKINVPMNGLNHKITIKKI